MSFPVALRRPARPLLAALAALANLAVLPLGAQAVGHAKAAARHAPIGESYSYTFRITTSDDDPITGVTHVLGDRSRIEITEEHGGARSDYLLVTPGGRLQVVRPDEREYSEIEADAFERIVGKAMEAVDKAMTFEIDDLDVTGRRLGAGGMVAGRPAERSRLSHRFDLRVGVLGFTTRSRYQIDTEYWTVPGLELPRNPLLELFASMPAVMALHDRGFQRRTAVARGALVGQGTPVRMVVTSRSTDDDGETDRSEMTVEILSIEPARHGAGRFQVPAGYRKTDQVRWRMESRRR